MVGGYKWAKLRNQFNTKPTRVCWKGVGCFGGTHEIHEHSDAVRIIQVTCGDLAISNHPWIYMGKHTGGLQIRNSHLALERIGEICEVIWRIFFYLNKY